MYQFSLKELFSRILDINYFKRQICLKNAAIDSQLQCGNYIERTRKNSSENIVI